MIAAKRKLPRVEVREQVVTETPSTDDDSALLFAVRETMRTYYPAVVTLSDGSRLSIQVTRL